MAEYIYRNLTFAVHVALMGMESVGYARYHHERLRIAVEEHQGALEEAVEYLSVRGIAVSLYNLPHCVLPQSLWKYARRSISDWKTHYAPACERCSQFANCAGIFSIAADHSEVQVRPL